MTCNLKTQLAIQKKTEVASLEMTLLLVITVETIYDQYFALLCFVEIRVASSVWSLGLTGIFQKLFLNNSVNILS